MQIKTPISLRAKGFSVFAGLVFKRGRAAVLSSSIPRFSNRQIEGGGENNSAKLRVLHMS